MPSHMYVAGALGRELIRRGNRVTFIGIPDVEAAIAREQLPFRAIGERTHPAGRLADFRMNLAKLEGFRALKLQIGEVAEMNEVLFRELPGVLSEIGANALIADQAEPAAGTVAEHNGMPWATICAAVPMNREPAIPATLRPWPYSENVFAQLRNQMVYRLIDIAVRKIMGGVQRQRAAWKLQPLKDADSAYSPYLQIAQMIAEFDFPRKHLPANFHYTGPFSRNGSKIVPFPWERLQEGTAVYASLGTMMNRSDIYRAIAEACARADVQLVLSLGGSGSPEALGDLPGSPLVVEYAPQQQLLQSVQLCITHGGLNSAQEALLAGVPCVVIPLVGDQPGVAARMVRAGAGVCVPAGEVSAERLYRAIVKVLAMPSHRDSAKRMQALMRQSRGVEQAAELVESIVR